MKITYSSVLLIFPLLFFLNAAFAQNQITYSVISSGGDKSSNESFILSGTVGESFIGSSVNLSNQNFTGFWFVYYNDVLTSVEDQQKIIPTVFKLEQNYPNPFNPSTIIKFAVPERNNVLIKIYDILGGEVLTLVNEELDAGWYERKFDAGLLSAGVYIYRMQAGSYVSTKKMMMLK
jgi:hypothetical protein